jgi:hypothetical protein
MNNLENTIFVTMASCEEYFLEQTVKSAMAMANKPERIFFGIFNNILKKEHSLLENDFFKNESNIFYAELFTPSPMGTGFGRMNASLLSTRNHDYVLQIDAHTVFTKDWDLKLIENFENISNFAKTDKVVLTAIPRGNLYYSTKDRDTMFSTDSILSQNGSDKIDPYNNNYHELTEYHNTKPEIRFDGWQGTNFAEGNVGLPITYGTPIFEEDEYAEVNCIHASIVFFKYSTIREVMHDPSDFFNGDQINHGLRLLSRGYKIFAIKHPLLLTLNKYHIETLPSDRSSDFVDPEWNWRLGRPISQSGADYQNNMHKNSEKIYKEIFSGEYLGYWGAPDKESLMAAKAKIGFVEK